METAVLAVLGQQLYNVRKKTAQHNPRYFACHSRGGGGREIYMPQERGEIKWCETFSSLASLPSSLSSPLLLSSFLFSRSFISYPFLSANLS